MAKINIDWINDEVVKDLVNNTDPAIIDGYVLEVEEEIDAICITQGQTAVEDIPLDDDSYYLSPILRVLSKYKLRKFIFDGYEGSSDGNVDIYEEKDTEALSDNISKWENRITYNSIRVTPEEASSSQAMSRSIPIGG